MNGKEAIAILKKDNKKCWIFNLNPEYLIVKFDGDIMFHLLNEEEAKNEIKKLANEYWSIIKNKKEW